MSFDREPLPSIERSAPYVVQEVRDYVRNVSDRIARGRGLWFAGDVGTGKTTLAMLVSKAALQANHTVAIYSLPRLLALLRETFSEASRYSLTELVDRLCAVDLLHIDDVGAEQTSDWVLEQLYTIVNTRYEDGRPLVLTTNLILKDAVPVVDPKTRRPVIDEETGKQKFDQPDAPLRRQIGERTVSRLYEICGTPLPVYGGDSRPRGDVTMPPAQPENHVAASDAGDDDPFWEGAPERSRYGQLRETGLGRRPLD